MGCEIQDWHWYWKIDAPVAQDEADEAFKSADEEDKDAEEEAEASEAENSDDSGFGLSNAKDSKKTKKTAPMKRFTKKGPETSQTGEVQQKDNKKVDKKHEKEKDPETMSTTTSKASGSKNPDKVMSIATGMLNSLRQVTPLSLWSGTCRLKDIGSKLNKAMDFVSKLEGFEGNKPCEDLAKELSPVTTKLSKWHEIVEHLKAKDISNMRVMTNLAIHKDQILGALLEQPDDCLKVVLTDIGKCLVEASKFPNLSAKKSPCHQNQISPRLKSYHICLAVVSVPL